jgi:hypothetical protein
VLAGGFRRHLAIAAAAVVFAWLGSLLSYWNGHRFPRDFTLAALPEQLVGRTACVIPLPHACHAPANWRRQTDVAVREAIGAHRHRATMRGAFAFTLPPGIGYR